MDPANADKQPEEPRFLKFPQLPKDARLSNGEVALNRHSGILTREHDFPGAQVGDLTHLQLVA